MQIDLHEKDLRDIQKKTVYSVSFNFFNVGLELYADCQDSFAAFSKVYENFICRKLPETFLTFYIVKKTRFHDGPLLIQSNGFAAQLPSDRTISGIAEQIIFTRIMPMISDYIIIHAGVVSKKNNGTVIIAPSGFGKTTLVLELLSRGYNFLSDEFCLIRKHDYCLDPFPRRVGIKENSPFFGLVDTQRALYLDFEGKYFADPADLFPASQGQRCVTRNIILLVENVAQQAEHTSHGCYFDLMLLNQHPGLLDRLSRHPDVEMAYEVLTHGYPAYRFRAADNKSLMAFYQDIWGRYEREILGVTIVEDKKPCFDKEPQMRQLPKSEASFRILTHMINRSPGTSFFNESAGKASSMLLTVGKIVENVNCYTLEPGHLSMMGDMIDNLQKYRR
jgi:hypothetical protein